MIALSLPPICGHCRRVMGNTGKKTTIRYGAWLYKTTIHECSECGNTVLLPDSMPYKPSETTGDCEEAR